MQWYYSKNSTQLGPVPLDELRAKLASGEISGADLVWRDGLADWKPASGMPELQMISREIPGVPPPAMESSPYAPPVASDAIYVPVRTSGLAIASLVCGIFGLFCMLVPGIAAVICGHLALRDIRNSAGTVQGRGLAIAGLILGYLAVVLLVLWGLLLMIGLASGFMAR